MENNAETLEAVMSFSEEEVAKNEMSEKEGRKRSLPLLHRLNGNGYI